MDCSQAGSPVTGLGERDLLCRKHEQLDKLLGARDQTEKLLEIVVEIGSDLDLDVILHRVVDAAKELAGTRFGALGVCGSDGNFVSFVQEGFDVDAGRWLAKMPTSRILEGDNLAADLTGAGCEQSSEPLRVFVGIPITLRGNVLGNLYLADDRPDRVFTESEQGAAWVLAAAAAVAISNAQLFERDHAAARWMKASREIMAALLSGGSRTQPLQLIVDLALELARAEQAILLLPFDPDLPADEIDTLVVAATAGQYAEQVIGQSVPVNGSTTGSVARSRKPLITNSFKYPIEGFTDVGDRSAVVMPLYAGEAVVGVLAVARHERQRPFGEEYLGLVSDFATHAAIAVALAAGREHAREAAILADRERIAHDLHDHVIQKLFAAGLDLQGTIARSHSPDVINRLTRTVDDLQATIEDIRATIFKLQTQSAQYEDFRQRIQNRVAELTEDRNIATTLEVSGALATVTGELADHADAVVTEAVSNAVRHANARRLTVRIVVDHLLTIDVIDDGRGIPVGNQRRSGLNSMTRRATQLGGDCTVTVAPGGGTWVCWTAPLA